MSGPNALFSLKFLDKKGLNVNQQEANLLNTLGLKKKFAHYRKFYDDNHLIIDHGYMIYFPKHHSFTGEGDNKLNAFTKFKQIFKCILETVEFHIHGSRAVQSKFLSELGKIKSFRPALNVFFHFLTSHNDFYIGRIYQKSIYKWET